MPDLPTLTVWLILLVPCGVILMHPLTIFVLLCNHYKRHPWDMLMTALRNDYWKDTYSSSSSELSERKTE
jgi:hypothetical protein